MVVHGVHAGSYLVRGWGCTQYTQGWALFRVVVHGVHAGSYLVSRRGGGAVLSTLRVGTSFPPVQCVVAKLDADGHRDLVSG